MAARAIDVTVLGDSVHGALATAADSAGETPLASFTATGSAYTRSELWEASRRVAAALTELGIQPGDRVCTFIDNRGEFLEVVFGCLAAGAVAVPLNTALQGDILENMVHQASPRVLVIESAYSQQWASLLGAIDGLEHVITVGDADGALQVGPPVTVTSFDAMKEASPAPYRPGNPGDLAMILYSSGTTGRSKGVMWTNRMLLVTGTCATGVLGYEPDDVVFTCLPLFHGNALITTFLGCLTAGASVAIAPRFSASAFWQTICEQEATITGLLGTMAPILWRQPETHWERDHNLRRILVIPGLKDRQEEFEARFGVEVTELYGSEAGIPLGIPAGERRVGSCGKPTGYYECALVDEADEPVEQGEVGELVVRPRAPWTLPLGYWRAPEATIETWQNLWLHTGDLLREDDEGWFYFADRAKDAIRRSGENISSFEVEEVLISHPDVAEAAAFGVPSELAEEEVMAAVVLRPGVDLDHRELVAFCEDRLPYFAVPRYYDFRASLPKTETEKVRKGALREEGVTDTTRDAGPRGVRMREKAKTELEQTTD